MDPNKAFEQLRLYQPAKPEWALLPVVAAAVSQGASYVHVGVDAGGTIVDSDGSILSEAQASKLFEAPGNDAAGHLRELAIGLYALNSSEPSWVTYEGWDGHSGVRLKIESGKIKQEKITKAPWKESNVKNRVRVQLKKGWRPLQGLFGSKAQELPPEAFTVEELCRYSSAKLDINGQVHNVPAELGRSLVCMVLEPNPEVSGSKLTIGQQDTLDQITVDSGGPYGAIIALGGDRAPTGTLALIVNGVLYQKPAMNLAGMGVRAMVAAPHLEISADHADVVENDDYETLLKSLEEKSLGLAELLSEQVIDMNAIDRVEATDYIKQFANRFEELGQYKKAEDLYRKLLEAQEDILGDDDAELAPTLLKIAHLNELQQDFDDCLPVYRRVLEIYQTSKSEPEVIASAQAGLANIHLQRDELEQAEEMGTAALKLRKAYGDPYDLDLGLNYEMLARIYRTRYTYPHRNFLEVDTLYLNALKIFEKNFGSSHLDVAQLLHDLAEHRRSQRRYREAEPLYRRALKIRTESVGEMDALVAQTIDSIGGLYEEQGKSGAAGEQYQKALLIWEQLLGADDPDYADRLNNLVVLYRVYGRFSEAEPLYQQLLNLHENRDDADPQMVVDLVNLALLYQAQRKLDEAEPLLSRALHILENLPDQEGDKAWVLNHLGTLFDQQRRFDNAEAVLKRTMAIWEQLLGLDNLDLTVSLDSMVRHYRLQDKFVEAEHHARRSLQLREKHLGVDHAESICCLGSLAEIIRLKGEHEEASKLHHEVLLRRTRRGRPNAADSEAPDEPPVSEHSRYSGAKREAHALQKEAEAPAKIFRRYTEAEHLYLRALFAQEQALGPSHPEIAYALDHLAELYKKHRKFDGAEELYKRTLALRQEALGKYHPDVCLDLESLIEIYSTQKRYGMAEPLAREWLEIVTTTVGEAHPEAARVMEKLAEIAGASGNTEKQEEYGRKALEIRQAALGTEHPDFATSLADLLCLQKKYEEAGKLYGFVVNCLEENLGPESAELIPIYEKYAGVLRKLNKESLAVELETQAMVMRVQHGLDFGE